MQITLNSNALEIEGTISISNLLMCKGYKDKLVAVAVNGEFMPRENYDGYILQDKDSVEIVAPMQGG